MRTRCLAEYRRHRRSTHAPVTAIAIGAPDHSRWASTQAADPYISLVHERIRRGAPKPSIEEMTYSS
ncbi:hypothetical protein SprV_0301204900 [Sparganum proliferum]